MKIEDKAYFDGGYFRTAATPLSLFTKDLRETLRRLAAIVNCPIKGFGNLTTQNEFSNKINQLKTWVAADIAKMENDKLKETVPAMAIHRHHWIRDRKEVIAELKKIEDTKISLLPTVAKNAIPVEDKAYFNRRIYHSTGTFHTLLDKETRVPIDGTSKWVTVDPAQYITPRRVRISGIKGEIEIAAQLSGDEIKGISAKAVKATAARQGSKAKFDNATNVNYNRLHIINRLLREVDQLVITREDDKAKKLATKIKAMIANNAVMKESKNQLSELNSIMLGKSFARQGSKAKFAKEYILWALPKGETDRLHERPIAEGLYTPAQVDDIKRKATAVGWHSFRVAAMMGFDDMTNALKGKGIKKGNSRTGTKSKFASDTNYAHKNTIKIKGKSDKIYALIYAEEGYGDNLTGFWNGHVQNNSNPKVKDMVVLGKFKSKEAAKAAAIKALKQEEQGTNFSKAKFANRGAFAEASSSPVLGSLLEKKVMPEGGWRAVETDGGALVIAFEDGDIAGNFARRASENGYSATAPMAMAGRFWNVKVQNENKQ